MSFMPSLPSAVTLTTTVRSLAGSGGESEPPPTAGDTRSTLSDCVPVVPGSGPSVSLQLAMHTAAASTSHATIDTAHCDTAGGSKTGRMRPSCGSMV